jgi:hypothetical protein
MLSKNHLVFAATIFYNLIVVKITAEERNEFNPAVLLLILYLEL